MSSEIETTFNDKGYYFPVNVIAPKKAKAIRAKFLRNVTHQNSQEFGHASERGLYFNPHIRFKYVFDVAASKSMLDVVEALIGPDILIWASTFFIKDRESGKFIPWHQDQGYAGSQKLDYVTGWVALNRVNNANGCMQYLPSSHKLGHLQSSYRVDNDSSQVHLENLGTSIDVNDAISIEMSAGQASFHHGHLLHSSKANRSRYSRVGLAINYTTPQNERLSQIHKLAMLVRGRDRYGLFNLAPAPIGSTAGKSLK